MDMYQKREQRKKDKAKDKNNTENNGKININWDIGTYAKTHSNPYKIRILSNLSYYIFEKKRLKITEK